MVNKCQTNNIEYIVKNANKNLTNTIWWISTKSEVNPSWNQTPSIKIKW